MSAQGMDGMRRPYALIATWDFSLHGVAAAAELLHRGKEAEEAAALVAMAVEDDPNVETVGYGAWPNLHGEMELDAAVMRGQDLRLGAVLGLQGYKNPVAVARLVLNRCAHNVLVGRGAADFALAQGCEQADMLTPEARERWLQRLREMDTKPHGHDTVGALALDGFGHLVAATSTSGLAMKLRGRVGDSALVGSGLYADDEAGAAAATGVGEDIMRGCLSFVAVELMRQGAHPREAAEQAVLRVHHRLAQHGPVGNMAIVCMDRQGRVGGAANHEGFAYAMASQGEDARVVAGEPVV